MATFDTAEAGAALMAQRCEKASKVGTSWQACCPAHEDRTPSLSITPTGDRILLHCHAGCAVEDIVAALGLTMADLFVGAPSRLPPARRCPARRPPPPPPPPAGPPRVTAIYPYPEAQGAPRFRVLRWEPGFHGRTKSFTQQRPDPAHPGAWRDNMHGVTRVLYNLPAVLRAVEAGETIYLPEGEKDANKVIALGLTATTNAGGAAKWEDQYTETLRGAHVVLLQDHDASGRRHTAVVTQALSGVAASLRVVELPDLPPKGDVSDWLAAGGTRAQLEALVAQTPLWAPAAPEAQEAQAHTADTPRIPITTNMTRVVDAGQAALLALPDGPVLFQQARRLCVVSRGAPPPAWLHRPPEMPTILEASPAHLAELAARAAQWQKYDKRAKAWEPALPPRWFVDALHGRPAWPFPPLEGIMHSPTLRPDGSVLDQPGYDAATGLYYAPGETTFPAIPEAPDMFDMATALQALNDALGDFPFAPPGARAAALAACLSMVCRFAIPGCVPLFAVTAPVRAAGKSYLVDTLSIIGTGRPAPRWPQVADEDEERKRLLTVALAGYPVIHLDNVVYPLGSPALDLALTSTSFSDRVLGQTGSVEAPLNLIWLASGNNLQYKSDTARRVVPITLDPQMEKPEERSGFAHDPLIPWVTHERPRLTIAALTVVKAFFTAGCPAQGLTPFGSFEAWSDLIRQALVWAGEADPCAGRKTLEEASNPEFETLAVLLHTWQQCYGQARVPLKKAVEDPIAQMQHVGPDTTRNQWNDLYDALASCDARFDGKRLDTTRIAHTLRGWQGRIIDGKRLVSPGKDRTNKTLWKIERV